MDPSPRVSIVILNWNGWKDTIECLESLNEITYPNYDIIVADNGSENDSIERIKEYAEGMLKAPQNFLKYSDTNKQFHISEYSRKDVENFGRTYPEICVLPPWKKLILIKNEKNFGFAEGNNIAIRYALKKLKPEYVLLLNNDTIVDKSFLCELVKVAESNKKIGFVGPKTYYYDYNGRTDVINNTGGRLVLWKGVPYKIGVKKIDHGQFDVISEVDLVEGSCLLSRRHVLEKVGLLDPSYFLYWEETDLCMRVRKAGYKLFYAPRAKIWHKIAASTRGSPNQFYYIRNCFIFTKKYANNLQFLLFLIYFFGFEFWFISGISLLLHRNIAEWESILRGIFAGMKR